MALAHAVQGARRPSQLITLTDAAGSAVDLSGAMITVRIRNLTTGVAVASDGAFVIVNAAGGVLRWDYSEADVSTAGRYEVQFTLAFGVAPTPARTIIEGWTIREAI